MRRHTIKFLILAICFISGCSSNPKIVQSAEENFVGGKNLVYVVSHGWPTVSVIHAVGVSDNVKRYFSNSDIEILCLNDSEYMSLLEFISNSLMMRGSCLRKVYLSDLYLS